MSSSLDPITLEVLTQALIAIVREMRATVFRTASSVAIYDVKDFSCGLFAPDRPGRRAIGGHRLARGAAALVGALLRWRRWAPTLRPGRRHPAERSLSRRHASQRRDDASIRCSRRPADLLPAVRAHWVDVGGMVPGSMSGMATEIYQEGMRIPPIKILRGRADERGRARPPARQHARARGASRATSRRACRRASVAEKRLREMLRPLRRGYAAGSRAASHLDRAEARHARLHRRRARWRLLLRGLSRNVHGRRVRAPAASPGADRQRRSHDRRLHRRVGASAVPGQLDGGGFSGGRLHHREVDVRPAGSPEPGLVPADRGHHARRHHRQCAAARAGRIARRDSQAR